MTNNLKIVSLLPSATEIVDCLGLSTALVGRSHECDYPLGVTSLPICTKARLDSSQSSGEIDLQVKDLAAQAVGIYEIELKTLARLKPTHIVTQDQCDVCAVNFAEVEKAIAKLTQSEPKIISLQPNLLQEVWQDITRVGEELGVEAQGIIARLQQRLEKIQQQLPDIPPEAKPSVVSLEWTVPLMTGGNWIPELIEIAGGKPLLCEKGKHSPYINWEKLISADPELIIIMPCGFGLERTRSEAKILTTKPQWSELKAVKENKVFIVDGNAYFNRPGPRLVDSTEIIAEILFPEIFDFGYEDRAWSKLTC